MSDPTVLDTNSLSLLSADPISNSHSVISFNPSDLALLSISPTIQPELSLNYGFDIDAIDQALSNLSFPETPDTTDQTITGVDSLTGLPEDYVSPPDINSLSTESISSSLNSEIVATVGSSFINGRWATAQGEFWNEQKWLTGDFNGDGRDDLANVFQNGRRADVDVYVSNNSSFTNQRWATQQGGFWNSQKWLVGDFNGDGLDDLAKVFNDGNQASIDVHLSNGSSFTIGRWATRQGGFANNQKWLVGDFNGDGRDDFASVFNDANQASINVYLSNGNSLENVVWATQQGGFSEDQKWLTGDFNGDGRDDLANVFNEANQASIDVHLSNGNSFTNQRWATQQGGFWNEQKWLAGDFNSDGQDDLANVFNEANQASIDVHLSNGNSFTNQRWATQQDGFWNEQKWLAGDFNGDGKDDLANVFNEANQASIDVHSANSLPNYSSINGYGLVNASAAVAKAIGLPTFAGIPDLGGNNWGADLIKAPEVWTKGYTGQGIVVAVLDSGVDYNHADLSSNIWTNTREIPDNGIDDDFNGYVDDFYGWNFVSNNNNTLDVYGHGTHVAGTIAAANNDFGVTGIAYNAKIMPVKVLGDDNKGTYSGFSQGIYYAVNNGAKVINMSLNGTVPDSGLEAAIQYAASMGVIVVMAVGNSAGLTPLYPAYYATNWGLAVGAVDSNKNLADFSNRAGSDFNMAYVTAPGVSVYSTLPNQTYGFYNGTSMAAPHVAGVAALILSANPSLTGSQVREIVAQTAVNV
ncbi:S8 family serine peptidase [Nostoc sp. 2RC]|uniref:S8 family serine peptidase n=1 Tax=Nostoc sp. 2RC TaxID=2485484 RepID=UPI00162AC2EA|nr:S8 family serine peptidase [Nostoc sp. 2RC]MBC1236330.1 S8 family serine peptidase [Nostoc sp. 2RC]